VSAGIICVLPDSGTASYRELYRAAADCNINKLRAEMCQNDIVAWLQRAEVKAFDCCIWRE
jgi:hypothetical protein